MVKFIFESVLWYQIVPWNIKTTNLTSKCKKSALD